ncbi:hypothetical protein ABIC83_002910 [Roseateles asaccharophilus]|uniref:hypothetical protein n=1 Tax=Roseateles asaccharophilus TaxID=582607 RepID=UPI0038383003
MSQKPTQSPTELAGIDFGQKMARRLFESRTKPGRATQAELHLNQEDLANMLTVAFEAGVDFADPVMKSFSCRAECQVDIQRLHAALKAQNISYEIRSSAYLQEGLPDVGVDLRAATTLEALRAAVATVDDGHVMVETLREVPLARNSLQRQPVAAESAPPRRRSTP